MRSTRIRSGRTTAFALLASTVIAQIVWVQSGSASPASASPDATNIGAPTDAAVPPAMTVAPSNTMTITNGAATARSLLSVPLPPYSRLRLDLDARDEDILGVVKSYFRGFKGQSLKELLSSLRISGAPPAALDAAGNAVASGTASDLEKAGALQLLSDADLGTMLRDINHMRIVFFEPPNPQRLAAMGQPAPQSVLSYYEQRYIDGEGGYRMVRGDFDDVQMLTVGFPQRGFAVVFQAPGMGVVVRADGYPNFEGIGPLVMAMLLRFAPNPASPPRSMH